MCLTQPATVLEQRPDALIVDLDGQRRLVVSLLVPEARVGDEVLVGMGSALAVLSAADAAALRELLAAHLPELESG